MVLTAADIAGVGLGELVRSGQLSMIPVLPPARALLSTTTLAVVIAVGARSAPSRVVDRTLLLLALAALVPPLLTSHVGHPAGSDLALASLTVHVPAVSLWVGGLMALVLLSPTAVHYTSAISITADTTLTFVAFDPSGNVSAIGGGVYLITNTPVPATPTFTTTSAGAGSVTLSWADSDPSVTGYEVQVYAGDGLTKLGAARPASPATAMTITDLTVDTAYRFTVVATNANGSSPESAMAGPLTPLGAVVANAGPDQTVTRQTTPTTVTLTGAGSTPAEATYAWNQVLTGPNDPDQVTLTGSATLSPSFTLALYKDPMTNKALTFRLTVTSGTTVKTDDVLVTPKPDQVSIGTGRWKVGDFRVTGVGSVVGGVITVHKGSPSGPVLGRATMTAAAAPATGGVFDLRLRNAAAGPTNPGTVWIESSVGGTAGPFTVIG